MSMLAQQRSHVNWLTHDDVRPQSRLKLSLGGSRNGQNENSAQENLVFLNSYFVQSIVAQMEPKLVRS